MQTSLFDSVPEAEEATPDRREGDGIVVGEVARVRFSDDETGFVVGTVRAADGASEVRFVGRNLPGISEGASVRLEGRWVDDPTYDPSQWYRKDKSGKQFEVRAVRTRLPVTREGVIRYIAGNVRGCGPARAARVVAHFGRDCLEVLAEEPGRVVEAFGTGRSADALRESWSAWAKRYADDRAVQEVSVRLAGAGGITLGLAHRIVERFGAREATEVVLHRPYDLCEVRGVGFRTADDVARGMGVALLDPTRIAAGVVHVLGDAMGQGHSGLPRDVLVRRTRDALDLDSDDLVLDAVASNLAAGTLIERGRLLFTRLADLLERRVASSIEILAGRESATAPGDREAVERVLAEDGLSPAQSDAVRRALSAGVFVLTGRPGAGKTTTVRTFLRCCDLSFATEDVAVVAPTGKAASRAAEVTGRAATTVHRLIGVRFGEVRKTPLRQRWVVLDEASMCDLPLMDWLLRNIDLGRTSLLLVGDVNQLPSVGHGQVLGDLIDSGAVETATLREVFRQSRASVIKVNANRILDGEPLDLENEGDFLFADITLPPPLGPDGFPVEDPTQSRRECEHGRRRLRSAVEYLRREGADPLREIQVLTPMRKGLLGVREVNAMLQDALNPAGRPGPRIGDHTQVREGDRVIQVKNDYTLGVFNGDQGEVVSVDPDERMVRVRFYEHEVDVVGPALRNLNLSWAITVHRSQGSEFPHCILLYHTSHYVMLGRSLLYTAMTRASRQFILVGNRAALDHTLKRDVATEERYTGLRDLLSAALCVADAA